jgi:hypothetical protein
MRLFIAMLLLGGGIACTDSDLSAVQYGNPLNPGAGAGDDDDRVPDDDDDDDSGGPYDDPNSDDDDAGVDGGPDKWLDECPPEAIRVTDFQGGNGSESYVKSWDRTVDEGSFSVEMSAYYAVYNTYVYESGGSQPNETAYFRIRNDASADGAPEFRNCGDEWIVQDHDNEGDPPGDYIFVGVFLLQEGLNTIAMHHYCPLFREGLCTEFHMGDAGGAGGCESSNPNSAHFKAAGICLLPWNPFE